MTNEPVWTSTRLCNDHDLSEFDCGQPPLNKWLNADALRAQESGNARTFVWLPQDGGRVRAYFSLTPTQVQRGDGYSRSACGGYSLVPAFLLARLALDQSLHGQRLGSELLMDALGRVVGAAEVAGGQLVVVDAIDDTAAAFYVRHDFTPVDGSPNRLYMKMKTARSILSLPM